MPQQSIFTKTGDKGKTTLADGKRVWKDDLRIEVLGSIDELTSSIGASISLLKTKKENRVEIDLLRQIQVDLLRTSFFIANPDYKDTEKYLEEKISLLEENITNLEKKIPVIKEFLLPNGALSASFLHLSRSICRRTERKIVSLSKKEDLIPQILSYINRLSDFLFVLARYINKKENYRETLWTNEKK